MQASTHGLRGGGEFEQRRHSHEGSTRLTIMLLAISFAFLITTLPLTIVNIGKIPHYVEKWIWISHMGTSFVIIKTSLHEKDKQFFRILQNAATCSCLRFTMLLFNFSIV